MGFRDVDKLQSERYLTGIRMMTFFKLRVYFLNNFSVSHSLSLQKRLA